MRLVAIAKLVAVVEIVVIVAIVKIVAIPIAIVRIVAIIRIVAKLVVKVVKVAEVVKVLARLVSRVLVKPANKLDVTLSMENEAWGTWSSQLDTQGWMVMSYTLNMLCQDQGNPFQLLLLLLYLSLNMNVISSCLKKIC